MTSPRSHSHTAKMPQFPHSYSEVVISVLKMCSRGYLCDSVGKLVMVVYVVPDPMTRNIWIWDPESILLTSNPGNSDAQRKLVTARLSPFHSIVAFYSIMISLLSVKNRLSVWWGHEQGRHPMF